MRLVYLLKILMRVFKGLKYLRIKMLWRRPSVAFCNYLEGLFMVKGRFVRPPAP